ATELPPSAALVIDPGLPTLIYTSYQLDPHWHRDQPANRVLLLEPSHFRTYPVSAQVLEFILALSENIPDVQVFVGEFDQLVARYGIEKVVFKEHPTTRHYRGTEEPRDWMFDITGAYPSFFAFWKQCKKQLQLRTNRVS
ncbi:MAG: hypothetical protein R3330_06075, partial [Saprospiraceae bacterium]|nr:hypothetical protein [Saprospiraceae bacterium]